MKTGFFLTGFYFAKGRKGIKTFKGETFYGKKV